MGESALIDVLVQQVIPVQQKSALAVAKADRMIRDSAGLDRIRRAKDPEKATLKNLSHTRLLSLIVEYSAQQLVVEGVTAGSEESRELWWPFERAGMPSRQNALNTAVLTYGEAYGLALPGMPSPYMRGFSPKNFGALFGDVVDDDHPTWAYRRIPQANGNEHWRLYDDEYVHFLSYEYGRYRLLESREHKMGVCPVVRFTASEDLDGNVEGEPEKYHLDAARHDKTVYDRLLIQNYNSWRTKYAEGMEDDLPQEEADKFKLKLGNDDVLTGYGETKFGTLDQTDLSPMKAAQESDRDTLAAVSQTPVWAFNGGSMVNLSADALIEAKSGNRQKVWTVQRGLNRPYCDFMRLGALANGDRENAERFDLEMQWADIGSQSMAAAADALGKMATNLGVPQRMLWELIPGVSSKRLQAWRDFAESHPSDDDAAAVAYARQVMSDGSDA